jgi:hypothetical protein
MAIRWTGICAFDESQGLKMYQVANTLGVRLFRRETDAYDYAIKIIQQTGIESTITKAIADEEEAMNQTGEQL